MLAEVDGGVRAELVAHPQIGGQVVVAGRQVRIVVDRDGVGAEATGRLNQDHQVAGLDCGDDDVAVGIVTAVDVELPGGGPQCVTMAWARSAGRPADQSR